jgi:hypothetical protein
MLNGHFSWHSKWTRLFQESVPWFIWELFLQKLCKPIRNTQSASAFEESVPWFIGSTSAFHSSFSLRCRTEMSSYPIHSYLPMRKKQKQSTRFLFAPFLGSGVETVAGGRWWRRQWQRPGIAVTTPYKWGANQVRAIYSAHRRSYILFPASPLFLVSCHIAAAASASRIFFSQGQSGGGIRSWSHYRHLSTRDPALRRVADRL